MKRPARLADAGPGKVRIMITLPRGDTIVNLRIEWERIERLLHELAANRAALRRLERIALAPDLDRLPGADPGPVPARRAPGSAAVARPGLVPAMRRRHRLDRDAGTAGP